MSAQERINQIIAESRLSNPVRAAAYALRYRGVCPLCDGLVRVTGENVVTSNRTFTCRGCQWTATVSEWQYRMQPDVGLGDVVRTAMAINAQRKRLMEHAGPRPAAWRARGDRGRGGRHANRGQSADVQPSAESVARGGDEVRPGESARQ